MNTAKYLLPDTTCIDLRRLSEQTGLEEAELVRFLNHEEFQAGHGLKVEDIAKLRKALIKISRTIEDCANDLINH